MEKLAILMSVIVKSADMDLHLRIKIYDLILTIAKFINHYLKKNAIYVLEQFIIFFIKQKELIKMKENCKYDDICLV